MGQDQSRSKNGESVATNAQGSGAAPPGVAGTQGSTVATVPLAGIEGFQVVRLLPYSPAHKAGLVPYFDIITSLDHVLLQSEGRPALQFFKSYVANHRDQPVCFTVFNLHIRAYRDVYCVPSDAWGGGGLLGCSIEWSRAEACPERCVHVMDVLDGSPAAHSGELRAERDYIIGMQTAQEALISLIKNRNDFYSRIEGWHEEQRWTLERQQRFPSEAVEVPHILLFLVYNSENNTVKEVAVEMGTNPEAALGMSVATGLLHIIPSAATAGDGATATALPVMNTFVRLEENRAITSTPDVLPPPPPPPPSQPTAQGTSLHREDEEEHQRVYGEAHHEVHRHEGDGSRAYQEASEELYVIPTGATPEDGPAVPPPMQGETEPEAPFDYPSSYPPTASQQQQPPPPPPPPAYSMPPPLANHGGPPPHEEATAIVVDPPVQAASAPLPPTPSAASHASAQKRKSPFQKALASLEAYEKPPTPHVLPVAAAVAPSTNLTVQPDKAQATPQQQPQYLAPQQHSPEAPEATATASHTLLATPPLASAHAAPEAPTPPPVPLAPALQHRAFSTSNMPPPLHFPVFPGAALKRQQK